MNHRQFLLTPELSDKQISDIRKNLEKSLAPTLKKYKFENNINFAEAEGVLLYYQTDEDFLVTIGARNSKNGIVVDVMQFHPGTGETKQYSEILAQVIEAIDNLKGYSNIEVTYWRKIQ